jgi:hypothetical protein
MHARLTKARKAVFNRLHLTFISFKNKRNYISNKVRVSSKKGCLGIYSEGGEVGAYIGLNEKYM